MGHSDRAVSGPAPDGVPGNTRDRILGVAHELFYWKGIRATGVDAVASAAGVAPPTLYRIFGSKDDLVAAYLERDAEGYLAWMEAVSAPSVGTPRDRILALFDALTDQVRPENCRGCPFLMALAEYPDEDSAPHKIAVATKAAVRDRFEALTGELGASAHEPKQLAAHLTLVLEGVYASVAALGSEGPAAGARGAAKNLIDAALR
jgi:AcrR family transcriptional regulator